MCCAALEKQFNAILNFVYKDCDYKHYGETFLVDVVKDSSGLFRLSFCWFHCHFKPQGTNSHMFDARNHEEMLRKRFKAFDMTITKNDNWWQVELSEPSKSNGDNKCIVFVPAEGK